jgi:hypothetical protein
MTSPRTRVALTIKSGADIKSALRPPRSRCPTSRARFSRGSCPSLVFRFQKWSRRSPI